MGEVRIFHRPGYVQGDSNSYEGEASRSSSIRYAQDLYLVDALR
jgi:hypothetical protein